MIFMSMHIHPSWLTALSSEFTSKYWEELTTFLKDAYATTPCFPPAPAIFRAFDLTPFDRVKVVILGQDPYHTPGAAMGLAFSVPNGSKSQPSLRNILKELESDLGIKRAETDLTDWAEQGVLLLNSVLTVRSGEAASHTDKGWEQFTDGVIHQLSEDREHIIFVLWGSYAAGKIPLIDTTKHIIIISSHPSPFSSYRGFFGSKPFSQTNEVLKQWGYSEIKWG